MASATPLFAMSSTAQAPRRQNRTIRASVKIVDRIANWTITIGGMMVIIAVAAIMIFLIQVVVPLFTGARVVAELEYRIEGLPTEVRVANVDEYRTIALALGAVGRVVTWHPRTGTRLADHQLDLGETDGTAFARTINR